MHHEKPLSQLIDELHEAVERLPPPPPEPPAPKTFGDQLAGTFDNLNVALGGLAKSLAITWPVLTSDGWDLEPIPRWRRWLETIFHWIGNRGYIVVSLLSVSGWVSEVIEGGSVTDWFFLVGWTILATLFIAIELPDRTEPS
jgi:hypothetical protein